MDETTGLIQSTAILWLALLFSLVIAAALTYIYSNKNLRLTVAFTVGTFVLILLSEVWMSAHYYTETVFLMSMDSSGNPYRISRPGFYLFIDSWYLWIFPSFLLSLVCSGIVYFVTRPIHSAGSETSFKETPFSSESSSQMVTVQLEIEALKHALSLANEKLSQVTLAKGIEEVKNRELQIKVKRYEKGFSSEEAFSMLQQEKIKLEMQIAQKNKEITQLKKIVDGSSRGS